MTKTDGYYAQYPTHAGYGMPRGPLGTHDDIPTPTAIGYCALCGSNARGTCSNKGMFDCPNCFRVWHDTRTGKIPRTIEDYFSHG